MPGPYTRQTWIDSPDHHTPAPGAEPLSAARLTHLEDGVEAAGYDVFNIMDREYYAAGQEPGNGNVTHDMTAIANVLADVMSGTPGTNKKAKRIVIPGGRDMHLNGSGVDWPNGVSLRAGPGTDGLVGRPVQFRWDGAAGGTMFNLDAGGGARVANTLIEECYFREGTARPGKWWELGDETDSSGVDFGTIFYRCQFANADAPAGGGCFDMRFGPTNFWLDMCRFDNWTGAAVRVAVNNAASHVSFTRGTMDNGGTAGGFPFWFDNTAMGSNKNVFAYIGDWKFECNVVMGGEKAIILCSLDHLATAGVQHHIHLEDFHVVPGGGGTDYSVVGARRTDAADTRNIDVQAYNTVLPACRLIDGVVDPPSYGSFVGRRPIWSYTPQGFGHATPGGEAVIEDHITQARFRDMFIGGGPLTDLMGTSLGRGIVHMHNALAAPSANPTAGGLLYVEGGALKYRGSSGTVTTLGPA
jgi:hypothetical protein